MAVAGLGLSLAIALIGICVILAFGSEKADSHDGHLSVEIHPPGTPSKDSPPIRTRVRLTDPKGRGTETRNESVTDFTYSGTSSDSPAAPQELWLIAAALFGALIGLLLPAPRKGDRLSELDGPIGLAIVMVMLAIFAVTGAVDDSVALQGVLAAGGAALVALPIPTPASYDPR
jgi:hypothetical protein